MRAVVKAHFKWEKASVAALFQASFLFVPFSNANQVVHAV